MLRTADAIPNDHGPPPRMLVLSGGKGGVGVTTLSVHLALALADQGDRVVLVDADLYRADVATVCGLQERGSVADVLTSRCNLHEILQPGPNGILVAPGAWAPNRPADYSEVAQQRLLRQLRTLGRHADIVLVDAGNGGSEVNRRFWQAADDVLLVTTPDPMAVMDCYATVKRLVGDRRPPAIRLLVNKADSHIVGDDVHQRIDASCRRFLGVGISLLGHVPPCLAVDDQVGCDRGDLHADADAAFKRLAVDLIAQLQRDADPPYDVALSATQENKHKNRTQLERGLSPMKELAVAPLVGGNLQRLNQL